MGKESRASFVVGGAGFLAGVWTAIDKAVRKIGGTDEHLHQLSKDEGDATIVKIAELIVGKTAEAASAISVAWASVLGWVIGLGRFTYVNSDITAEHFPPQPGDFAIKEVEVVNFGRDVSTEKAREFLKERGLRPATLMELLWWWLTHPKEQGNCVVVALGSLWADHVPCVGGGGAGRGLYLDHVARVWNASYSFAGVREDDKA